MKKIILSLLLLSLLPIRPAHAGDSWQVLFTVALKNGGAYVETDSGKPLFDHRGSDFFIPASIMKIATSACAIDTLGRDFRFPTEFYLTKDHKLAVKGYGDPFLVSEEIAIIAKVLKEKGLNEVRGLILDTTYFAPGIVIDGTSHTPNPYDALNGALIANFNTVNIHKEGSGARAAVVSAEPQTPLTPLAIETAKDQPGGGKQRVNIGADPLKGALYAGELITAFLKKEGIAVDGDMKVAETPADAKLIYRHLSSKSLDDVLRELLEYSTNFMSNQIFLTMGAEKFGAPATIEKGRKVLTEFLSQKVGWKKFNVAEGAGLSRLNQVTPRQMIGLLRFFEPYKNLLPKEDNLYPAKTGTLTGVNTLAGYMPMGNGRFARFAILVNDTVPFDYKFKLGKMLYAGINDTK